MSKIFTSKEIKIAYICDLDKMKYKKIELDPSASGDFTHDGKKYNLVMDKKANSRRGFFRRKFISTWFFELDDPNPITAVKMANKQKYKMMTPANLSVFIRQNLEHSYFKQRIGKGVGMPPRKIILLIVGLAVGLIVILKLMGKI